MNKSSIWLSLVAIIVSFVAGFMLANTINRSELAALKAANDSLKKEPMSAQPANTEEPTLSAEEIRAKIAEADANPEKFDFQKGLGIALYRYGALKQDAALIGEAKRLLERANQLNAKDYEVVLGLAHSNFDIAYYKKENAGFARAREFYTKALGIKPQDVEVQTEIAMTYFLLDPPDYQKAIPEFEKSLQIDPKHVKTLQFLGESYAKSGRKAEAEKTIATLKEADPNNPMVPQLTALISK